MRKIPLFLYYLSLIVFRNLVLSKHLSHVKRKPVLAICEQQRCRSACAYAQSDQCLCHSLPGWSITSNCYSRNFKTPACLCSWAGRFESYLVANLKDRLSRDETHLKEKISLLFQGKACAEVYCNNVCLLSASFGLYQGSKSTYRKFPKYSDTQKICCNHSKILTMWLYHRVMSPNDADGMANSVDQSGSALFAQAYLSKNLGSLR